MLVVLNAVHSICQPSHQAVLGSLRMTVDGRVFAGHLCGQH